MANLDARMRVIQTILADHPKAGWDLLLDILPSESGGMIHPSATPEWRYWAEGFKRGISNEEYSRARAAVVHLAIDAAHRDNARWTDLIGRLGSFSAEGFEAIVAALEAFDPNTLASDTRRVLWDTLRDKSQRQRYFRDSTWAWPESALQRIEALRDKFEPTKTIDRVIPLFGYGADYGRDKKKTFAEQQESWRLQGIEALKKVLAENGIDGVIQLARLVKNRGALGYALADASEKVFDEVLPAMLCSKDNVLQEFSSAYARLLIFRKEKDWSESYPKATWSGEEIGAFSAQMPPDERTWNFVASKGHEVDRYYWRTAIVFRTDLPPKDVEFAARKKISAGRPYQAVDLIAMNLGKTGEVSVAVQLELLEQAIATHSDEPLSDVDSYSLEELVAKLQKVEGLDESRLAKIEWALLPLLNRSEHRPETLHKLLSRDPSFLIELLEILYKPHSAPKPDADAPENAPDEKELEARKHRSERAWELIHEWRRLPGTREDGSIDEGELMKWFERGRALAKEGDRLVVYDITVGELFAYAPGEPDDSWPCIPVRNVLEKTGSLELLRGFGTGISNSRGVYWRKPKEGGNQERALAEKYARLSEACQTGWPQVGAVLKRMADEYKIQARIEDGRAESEK